MCVFYQKPHSPAVCTSVPDLSSRKTIVRNSGRCFNCLRKKHMSLKIRGQAVSAGEAEQKGMKGLEPPPPSLLKLGGSAPQNEGIVSSHSLHVY